MPTDVEMMTGFGGHGAGARRMGIDEVSETLGYLRAETKAAADQRSEMMAEIRRLADGQAAIREGMASIRTCVETMATSGKTNFERIDKSMHEHNEEDAKIERRVAGIERTLETASTRIETVKTTLSIGTKLLIFVWPVVFAVASVAAVRLGLPVP